MASFGYMLAWWVFPSVATSGEVATTTLVFPRNQLVSTTAFGDAAAYARSRRGGFGAKSPAADNTGVTGNQASR